MLTCFQISIGHMWTINWFEITCIYIVVYYEINLKQLHHIVCFIDCYNVSTHHKVKIPNFIMSIFQFGDLD
jgi:uncharacterized cysteine cluster protein YcgN (CxxCxxCC family)